MTSRRHSLRPTVVEVRPDYASSTSTTAPSTPPTPPSPKSVRFAPRSEDKLSRELTPTEAWSLYHFENHARQCTKCHRPLEVYRRGDRLCDVGYGLYQDVAEHVYHREGVTYSTKRDDSKLVRVEIPHGYSQVKSLLRALDKGLASRRPAPILSYDRTYPVSARRSYSPTGDAEDVTIIPAKSDDSRRYRPRSAATLHKPVRYATIVVNTDDFGEDDLEPPSPTLKNTERRGTLYERDMQRRPKDYRVEIREPSGQRRKRDQHRQSVYL